MKPVLWETSVCAPLGGALVTYATHMSDTILIKAYKHSVMVLRRLIDHTPMRRGIMVQLSSKLQIGINSAHVIVATWKLKGLGQIGLYWL